METIIYQGQEISVEHIGEINARRGEGMDTILRDELGRYYFRRELHDGDMEFGEAQETEEDGYRCYLHRINITAAILWSIDSGGDNVTLRQEAADCLMDVRSPDCHLDPNPHRYFEIKAARGKQSAAKWVKKVLAGKALPPPRKRLKLEEAEASMKANADSNATLLFADGSMAVTVYLAPEPARMFRAACELDDHDPVRKVYWAVEQDVRLTLDEAPSIDKKCEAIFDANVPDERGAINPYGVPAHVLDSATRHAKRHGLTLNDLIADALLKAAADHFGLPSVSQEETVTINLTSEETGQPWDTLELRQATYDEMERQAKERGQDFATFFVETVRKAVDAGEAKAATHRVTLDLTTNQTAKRGRIPGPVVPDAELPINEETRALLEKRARVEDTDLRAQYEFMTAHGTNAVMGFAKFVEAKLDPFHSDLLRTFERRHGIDADTLTREVLHWHLEEMYDYRFNGGECERNTAINIREYGSYGEELTPERVAQLCRAAGLNPDDYPDAAVDKEGAEENGEDDNGTVILPIYSQDQLSEMGRRHTADPADVALLAAAEPEPIEDTPENLPEHREVPLYEEGEHKGQQDDEDDNSGEEWKEGK